MPQKRARTHYVCTECGESSLRWFGRCPACEAWNTLVEEAVPAKRSGESGKSRGPLPTALPLSQARADEGERRAVGEVEIDRVLGGGVVPGSVVLVGGEPGVGKSTLLLQFANGFAARWGRALYISGEESARQVALRAARLGIQNDGLHVLSETAVDVIVSVIEASDPALVIIDSVQTMSHPKLESSPGSVAQVRESCHELGRLAKERNIPMFLVGHVNKQGSLAGPKVLEHMVDVVLSFEGEPETAFRILRATKNRFGSTHEVGIFQMMSEGLKPVPNPSELFLAERPGGSPGSVVTASHEGSRPVLVEVQALVGPTPFGGTPRRQVSGADHQRVSIILAVLEKRVGLGLQTQDVYVNVAGGVRVSEPACDLGIATAVASSVLGVALDPQTVVFGEVGLTGEVRSVSHIEMRMAEAARLGFRRVVAPPIPGRRGDKAGASGGSGIEVVRVRSVGEALKEALGALDMGRGVRD